MTSSVLTPKEAPPSETETQGSEAEAPTKAPAPQAKSANNPSKAARPNPVQITAYDELWFERRPVKS